ncbi:MAG TPA: excisionase family DNA-binding protein [Thermomicrobiaceae bacterium]|nr:excisionase family DNA-binding protein [Thermomicrobiaceae bacterium]
MAQARLECEPVIAREDERGSIDALAELLARAQRCELKLIGPDGAEFSLPESVVSLVEQMLPILRRGDGVSVIPVHRDLTTQQAAVLLNVSRQYLVQLLEQGDIPFHKVGTHRRVRVDDLLVYRRARDAERRAMLDRLDRLSQEDGLYQ